MKRSNNFAILIFILNISIISNVLQILPVSTQENADLSLDNIWIRDPNIFYYNKTYYMTGTTAGDGFLGYSSEDLINWNYEGYIYQKKESNYWAKYQFWAPEISYKEGKFYLWFTGKSDVTMRGTGVAVSNNPLGPYIDLNLDPLTPLEYDCLDGHLFTHPNGTEYFIYVYEWVQNTTAGIGEMWIQEIEHDYSKLIGKPVSLFSGIDAKWSTGVVDGPSMLYINHTYYLFWSSFKNGYGCGYAYSDDIFGPYIQENRTVINNDGGHSTWFRNGTLKDGEGELLITYHQPNSKTEHAHINKLIWNSNEVRWVLDNYNPNQFINGPLFIVILTISLISVLLIIRNNNEFVYKF